MFEDGVNDQAIWDELANQMTTRIDPSHPETQDWIQNYLRYYTSGNRVYVQDYDDTGMPEARFAKQEYQELGITPQEFISWLERQGVKKMKKPKPYKSTRSMYD